MALTRPLVEQCRPWSRRSTKWDLKGNTACFGQEKKKLWVNMAICLSLSLSLSFSHTHHRSFDYKKNKESFIFIKNCSGSSFFPHLSIQQMIQLEIKMKDNFFPLIKKIIIDRMIRTIKILLLMLFTQRPDRCILRPSSSIISTSIRKGIFVLAPLFGR